ncbi:MAG: acyltransferase [Firmicutes bacterium]|nr:acyltransferase [Bacillota bacterium]
MRKSRIYELDVFRAICTITVLLGHVTSYPVGFLSTDSRFYSLYLGVNSFCRFAIQAFLFLSGAVLAHSYAHRWQGPESALAMWRRRLLDPGIPYVVWSIIYTLLAIRRGRQISACTFLRLLATGKAWDHLYFIVLMFQFYLLFPLMLRALQSLRRQPWLWLGIGALIQAGFCMWDQRVFAIPNRASWAARFGFYLFAGMLAGLDFDILQDWTRKNKWPISAAWAVSAALNCSVSVAIRLGTPHALSNYGELIVNIYAIASCLFFLAVSQWVTAGDGLSMRAVLSLSHASFGIYLSHPLGLAIWRRLTATGNPALFHLSVWAGGAAVLAASWAVTAMLKRSKWGWMLVGK